MKVLVTGASGFVGRHVVDRLLKTDHEIIATSTGKRNPVETGDKLTYIPCDLNSPEEKAFKLFSQAEAVIHLAWEGLPNYDEMFHIERNLSSNYRFLKRLVESGVQNINVAGTCSEYGMQEGCLSERLPPSPNTAYGVAKNTLREFLDVLRTKSLFDFKWIRLFYMHGEGQGRNSILQQLKESLRRGDAKFDMSGGEQLRDYLPVETVAEHIVRIALQDRVRGIVNCGSGKPVAVRTLVEKYLEKIGASDRIRLNLGYYPYHPNEPMAFWADIEKLNSITTCDP